MQRRVTERELEIRVDRLEKRVSSLESEKPFALSQILLSLGAMSWRHVFGWAAVIWAVLVVIAGVFQGNMIILPFIVLLLGGGLLVDAEGWLDVSNSTRLLLLQGRSSKKVHADGIHPGTKVRSIKAEKDAADFIAETVIALGVFIFSIVTLWFMVGMITDPAWQLAIVILVPLAALTWGYLHANAMITRLAILGVFAVLTVSPSALAAVLFLPLATITIGAISWHRREWLAVILVTVASYGVLARFGLDVQSSRELQLVVLMISLLTLVSVLLPFIYESRTLASRLAAKWVFGVSALYYVVVSLFIGSLLVTNLTLVLLLLVAGFTFLGFGAASWWQHKRASFAKYYAVAFAGILTLVSLLLSSNPGTGLVLVALSLLATAAGFNLPSYSARLVGLVGIGLASAYYCLVLVGSVITPDTTWYLADQLVVGIPLVVALCVMAVQYEHLESSRAEESLRNMLTQALYAGSLGVLNLMSWSTQDEVYAHLIWLVLGSGYVLVGLSRRHILVQAAGITSVLVGAMGLLFIDTMALSSLTRAVIVGCLALFLIAAGSMKLKSNS